MVKLSFKQEEIAILNVYSSNNKASKYMKQNLVELQGEIYKSIIIVGNFNYFFYQ